MAKSLEHSKNKILLFRQQSSKALESNPLTDYDNYTFSPKELVIYGFQCIFIASIFAYVFYRSIIAFFILLPFSLLSLRNKKAACIKKRKNNLSFQFKELMNSLICSLQAGYSVENSIEKSHQDMCMIFGHDSIISMETDYMIKGLKNNQNIEELLTNFGERSHVQDIKDFSEIFKIAKRSGGDMPSMIRHTCDIISDKMDVQRRISTIIASKKMEQSIMNFVPFGIVLYIDASSPGFFNSLYHNPSGIVIMTIVMTVYLAAYYMSEKITDIKI